MHQQTCNVSEKDPMMNKLLRIWTLTLDLVMLVLLLAAPAPAPAYVRIEPNRPTR
jgi:hypothetical protein